jgi:hypothetical protein
MLNMNFADHSHILDPNLYFFDVAKALKIFSARYANKDYDFYAGTNLKTEEHVDDGII